MSRVVSQLLADRHRTAYSGRTRNDGPGPVVELALAVASRL